MTLGRRALLVLANALIPISILVFATGFFPYKPFLPGLAEYQKLEYGDPPAAPFDKVVFMVVDALRSDFVFGEGSGFKFTQSLISAGSAIPFTANARSPTITMPRVKAITTGSIPSFLDVILNFAESDTTSTLANQDSWLAQLKAKEGGKLVMYGDDTWLKLFPDTFGRADGTSSFFVSDFTEVDNNVTRHVQGELRQSDWNGWIMHYLGLDHIGHKAGPHSPNMLPKQIEMDNVVKQTYTAIESEPHLQSTLLILCGDHGMNEAGNHGGSAPGETSPALVFMSPKLKKISKGSKCPTLPSGDFDYYTKIEQSDIAPTLAGLLGFPVPRNNLGVFILQFLDFWDKDDDRVQLMLRNALQMLTIVKETFPHPAFENPFAPVKCGNPSSAGDELACKWRTITDIFHSTGGFNPAAAHILPPIVEFCTYAQDVMSSTASNYDVSKLIISICIISVSFICAMVSVRPFITIHGSSRYFGALLLILYSIMMFASSYVEEEQNFWYWIASGWTAWLFVYHARQANSKDYRSLLLVTLSCLQMLISLRLVRRWNQTGQKFAGAPDIVAYLRQYPTHLWLLITVYYLYSALRRGQEYFAGNGEQAEILGRGAVISLTAIELAFKLAFTAHDAPELTSFLPKAAVEGLLGLPLVGLARVLFIGLTGSCVWLVWNHHINGNAGGFSLLHSLHLLLLSFLAVQTRTENVPLYIIFSLQYSGLSRLSPTPSQTTLSSIVFAHASFFALGNSNAISSIDLSNAYNGISGYNVLAVGVLVFVSNWAGPIFWSSASILLLCERASRPPPYDPRAWIKEERARLAAASGGQTTVRGDKEVTKNRNSFSHHVGILTVFTAGSLLAVMAACTLLRTHLFIWTVFSPKYLYAMAWGIAYHLGVSVGLGALLWSTN